MKRKNSVRCHFEPTEIIGSEDSQWERVWESFQSFSASEHLAVDQAQGTAQDSSAGPSARPQHVPSREPAAFQWQRQI